MTNRVTYAPQDFQKMCKQAERDSEKRKLIVLMERVKRQIAERDFPGRSKKDSAVEMRAEASLLRMQNCSVPLER